MSRSSKKGLYIEPSLFKKVNEMQKNPKKKPIKTWSRRSTIYPEFVGLNFQVHNGRNFINVYVTEHMVGHKLGEFAPTRVFKGHTVTKKEKQKAKK